MDLDIEQLRKLCMPGNFELTLYAAKRLEQRGISLNDVICCIMNGEIIEQYPNDYPYPSCLILGCSVNDKSIHTVIGSNMSCLWIITAYYPDTNKWNADLKTRKEL